MAKVDMESARSTYGGFVNLLKWAVPAIAIIAMIVVFLIAE